VDSSGNVYVADRDNHRIRKITTADRIEDRMVSTLAGSGDAAFTDATGNAAKFNYPSGVAVDSSGNVYVADRGNHRIRKITPAGVLSTLAGTGTSGYRDGAANTAKFDYPGDLAVDSSGNVYVADTHNDRIRKITPAGVVTTFAGSGTEGFADGAANTAKFDYPTGVAVDSAGNVYVADSDSHRIRKIEYKVP